MIDLNIFNVISTFFGIKIERNNIIRTQFNSLRRVKIRLQICMENPNKVQIDYYIFWNPSPSRFDALSLQGSSETKIYWRYVRSIMLKQLLCMTKIIPTIWEDFLNYFSFCSIFSLTLVHRCSIHLFALQSWNLYQPVLFWLQ